MALFLEQFSNNHISHQSSIYWKLGISFCVAWRVLEATFSQLLNVPVVSIQRRSVTLTTYVNYCVFERKQFNNHFENLRPLCQGLTRPDKIGSRLALLALEEKRIQLVTVIRPFKNLMTPSWLEISEMVNYGSIFQTSNCFPLDIKLSLQNSGDQEVSPFFQTFINLLIKYYLRLSRAIATLWLYKPVILTPLKYLKELIIYHFQVLENKHPEIQ